MRKFCVFLLTFGVTTLIAQQPPLPQREIPPQTATYYRDTQLDTSTPQSTPGFTTPTPVFPSPHTWQPPQAPHHPGGGRIVIIESQEQPSTIEPFQRTNP